MGTLVMLTQTKTKTRKNWMITTLMNKISKLTEIPTIYSVLQNLTKLRANSSETKYCLMLFDWDHPSITILLKLRSNFRISLKLRKIRDWRSSRTIFKLLWVSITIRKCISKLRIYGRLKASKNHSIDNILEAVIWRSMPKRSWIRLFIKNYVKTAKRKIRKLS